MDMVDRTARDELAATIERYLDEEITAFEFDAEIFGLADGTEDATVEEAVLTLYFYYDDSIDHKVVATKRDWDLFQRVLLLLRSDGELVRTRRRRWTVRQPIAACGVVAFGLCALALGFTQQLLLVCIPLGCISGLLYGWRRREEQSRPWDPEIISPFSSVAEMLGVRRLLPGFAKRRYPGRLRKRRIRGRVEELVVLAWSGFLWFLLSPLVLLIYSFPEDDSECRVVVSGLAPEGRDA